MGDFGIILTSAIAGAVIGVLVLFGILLWSVRSVAVGDAEIMRDLDDD